MLNAFPWKVSGATLLQLGAELSWLFVAAVIALVLNGSPARPIPSTLVPAIVFALLMVFLNGAFGLYRRDQKLGLGEYIARVFLAMLIGAPIAYLVADLLPGGDNFQHTFREAVILSFTGLILVRRVVVSTLIPIMLPHRVLVLGTGPEARLVEASLSAGRSARHAPRRASTRSKRCRKTWSRRRHIVARSRRARRNGAQPRASTRSSSRCASSAAACCRCAACSSAGWPGVRITDLARFFERVHGQIPIDSLKVSWLIYGNGFRQNWLRDDWSSACSTSSSSLTLLVVTLPIMLIAALLIMFESGAPIVYRQERVGLRGKTFDVLKFRSMRKDAEKDGKAAWAAVNDARVTEFGRFMRRTPDRRTAAARSTCCAAR